MDAQPQTLVTSVAQAAVGAICVGGVLVPFQYCDAGGGAAAAPVSANLRTVVVNLQVGVQNQPPAIWQTGAIRVTMSDRIRLRNRIP